MPLPNSFAARGGFQRVLGMSRELFEKLDRPFVFSPTGHGEVFEASLAHELADSGQFALNGFEPVDGRSEIIGRHGPHSRAAC